MTDFATARAEIERHVDDGYSPLRSVETLGDALLRVSTDALGTGPTEAIFTGLFRRATQQHARRRGQGA